MKKILIWISTGILVTVMAFLLMAADNTRRPHWYHDWGFTASDMVEFVIDSSTTIGTQLKRHVNARTVELNTIGEDSLETCVWGAPTGYTATITGLFLTAFTEVSGSNDSVWAEILWYNAGTLDTMVAKFPIDADSANYDNNLLELTRIDSSLAAGDVIFWRTMALEDSAQSAVGAALIIEYTLDE